MPARIASLLLLGAFLAACTTGDDAPDAAPLSHDPSDAVAGLDPADGLAVTLFAAEPMVVNPTNIDVDARGRVWVCEGVNYRPNLNPGNPTVPEGDRIVILEDTDGDGAADERTVFYQGTDVNAALGIAVLGNRVIVSKSPNVFLFTDTDGDGRADEKEVLFTGIGGQEHDHGMHAFVFGPDGRLYFNFGNEAGQLLDARGNPVVDIHGHAVADDGRPYRQGMVLRMNPDGTGLEVLAHNFRNNYEVAVDAFGSMWQSDNDDDGNRATRINYVMPYGNYGFRDEMTGAGWRERRTGMHEEIPKRHWHLNDPGVVPNLLQTGAGSPTGIAIYEGRLLPARYHDQIVHADAGPNVVRAYLVADDGAGYSATIDPLLDGSRNPWFRPSDVAVAPDGSLIVADWYDPGVGGHQVGDLERGRIFRVAPPGVPYTIPEFDLSTPEGAVEALQNPGAAVRYLAWQALEAQGSAAEAALGRLWLNPNPRFRARALWLLSRLDERGSAYVDEALRDPDPNLRIAGLRAAAQRGDDLIPIVGRLVDDPSPQVRRAAAVALRHHDAPEAAGLWARLAMQHDGQDRWYLEALGIGADGQWDRFFPAWMAALDTPTGSPAERDIIWRARTPAALPMLAALIDDESTGDRERLRYFRAFDFHAHSSRNDLLAGLLDSDHPARDRIALLALHHIDPAYLAARPHLHGALDRALAAAGSSIAFVDLVERFGLDDRSPALVDLALAHPDSSLGIAAAGLALGFERGDLFGDALDGEDPAAQRNALQVLGHLRAPASKELTRAVLADTTRPMPLRRMALEAFGSGWEGENLLVEALDAGTLPGDLASEAAERLLTASRDHVRAAGMRVLGTDRASSEPLPDVAALTTRTGNPESGRGVFEAHCASCHVVQGRGVEFGPNLSEIGTKLSPEALFVSVLQPSAGVGFGYEGYLFELQDGSAALGYIVSETDEAVELRVPGGQTRRLNRQQIVSREMQRASLMPANLHLAMTEQELVDLVAYLKGLKATP